MYKRKNKRSSKALTPRVATKAAPVSAAAGGTGSARSKESGKTTSMLGRLADKVADTGLAVLHRIEEIPAVKKAEEILGVRQEA